MKHASFSFYLNSTASAVLFRALSKIQLFAVLMVAALLLSACGSQQDRKTYLFQGFSMGTTYTIKTIGLPVGVTDDSLHDDIKELLALVDRQMSTYKEDSELSRLNKALVGDNIIISEDLSRVLSYGLQLNQLSRGYFEMTIGPLVDLWGFGPSGAITNKPSEAEIKALKESVGSEFIQLLGQNINKRVNVSIDLSAIAKGFAVDRIAAYLDARGVENYLLEVGGELRAKGTKPYEQKWRIAIENPEAESLHESYQVVELTNISVATSGDYRNYFEENGVRYSHTINPKTAKPIEHRLASVTVLSREAMHADGLATALMAMGPDKGYAFAQQQDFAAYFIVKTDDGFINLITDKIKPFLISDPKPSGDEKVK